MTRRHFFADQLRRVAAVALLVASVLPFAAKPAAALAAYIHVNTSSDVIAGDGQCSLREAINATNSGYPGYYDCDAGSTGIDTIYFDVSVVNIASQLPTILVPVHIDSYLGGPRAELHGPGSGTGLLFGSNADGTTIRNLIIDNFAVGIDNGGADMTIASNVIGPNSTFGIQAIDGTVTIGGSNPGTPSFCSGDCNRISGNAEEGIYDHSDGSVTGNVIGLDASGAAAQPNLYGMEAGGIVTVGGATADLRNVISGNTNYGLGLPADCSCTVQGNYIGTDLTGKTAIPNGTGVYALGADPSFPPGTATTIGGENPGDGNVISGNSGAGILADKWGLNDSLHILGNRIGVGATGGALGNGNGIVFGSNPNNYVTRVYVGDPYSAAGSNTIAYNSGAGVLLSSNHVSSVYIVDNSIHDNTGKGISLVGGADVAMAPPAITGVSPVHGTACSSCEVDVYSDAADEGKKFEGYTVADGSGHWTFSGTPSGPHVTALAISGYGTSEFSASVALPVPPATKPDGRIRKGSGSYVGNNIYNTTGANQTKTGSAAVGATITFGISIQNDAAIGDRFRVGAAGANVAGYTIRYFHGTTDITAAVVAGTYQTTSVGPTLTWTITAKVTIGSTALVNSSVTRLITITSVGNATKKDAVRLIAKRS